MAEPRRTFLERVTGFAVIGGLFTAYGTFASFAARFLYPTNSGDKRDWQFVAIVDRFLVGESRAYVAPNGATVALARQADAGKVDDFVALSSTCPHLGCQVHWQSNEDRFFCPCHNGAFGPSGLPIAGPPKEANQSLPRYPLKIEKGLLYIHVPLERLG